MSKHNRLSKLEQQHTPQQQDRAHEIPPITDDVLDMWALFATENIAGFNRLFEVRIIPRYVVAKRGCKAEYVASLEAQQALWKALQDFASSGDATTLIELMNAHTDEFRKTFWNFPRYYEQYFDKTPSFIQWRDYIRAHYLIR